MFWVGSLDADVIWALPSKVTVVLGELSIASRNLVNVLANQVLNAQKILVLRFNVVHCLSSNDVSACAAARRPSIASFTSPWCNIWVNL